MKSIPSESAREALMAERARGLHSDNPFTLCSERIARLREASRKRGERNPPKYRDANFKKAFFEIHQHKPHWERYARSMAYALENAPIYMLDDANLVGMLYQTVPDVPYDNVENEKMWSERFCVNARMSGRFEKEVGEIKNIWAAPGHVGWRWDIILEHGVDGLMARIKKLLAAPCDAKAKRFYRGALIMLRAVLKWNRLHIKALREKARTASVGEKKRLGKLIKICEHVPRLPARNFREALQSFYLQYLAVMFENPFGGNGAGRLDYFLWPYLENDLATGAITMAETRELIDELFIRFDERLHNSDGWVESVIVGGLGPDGIRRTADAVNPLSHLMIESFAVLDITHPSVYVRLSNKSPEDFFDLCVNYMLHGKNRAQIYNEEACIKALRGDGKPFEDAAMYMAGGCMEISVQGANCDLNFAWYHSVAKILELVLTGGVDLVTGETPDGAKRDLTDYDSFDELYEAFEDALHRFYAEVVKAFDIASECYARYRPTYLLSSMTLDCLERGREQQDGGARYDDYGYAPLAIQTAADSLGAIKRALYDEKTLTRTELLEAIKVNYVGCERIQARLDRLPRYGVGNRQADEMCDRVLNSVCTIARSKKARFGGSLKPMVFNFVWTPEVSRDLGARGDGSRAGDMVGHGTTPASRAMAKGITAAINSATSLDYSVVSGGATTMWDLDPEWVSFELLKPLMKVFMERGGMIFQGNTTDVAELKKAMESPEEYQNLIVRVGGFSARFVTLNRSIQLEIINRRRHRG